MKTIKITSVICLMIAGISTMHFMLQNGRPVLKETFKKDFLIGAALNDDLVYGKDPSAAEIVKTHCNTITAENVMKWVNIHPEPGRYEFSRSDRFVEFGQKNKMLIIGHTLIWHHQIPAWTFKDSSGVLLKRDGMLSRMKDHIYTVAGRYREKIKGWDVVNEALDDDGSLRNTDWVKTIGEDFIEKAFEYAHEADPDAELYYNDFLLDRPAKRDGTMKLIRNLKSKGIRIDGIGLQWHCGMDYPSGDEFNAFVDSVSSTGLKVMITEMDVDILPSVFQYNGADIGMSADLRKELNPYTGNLPESMQNKLADRYSELFRMMLKNPGKISRVTFWGVYDKTSWLNNWPVRGRTNYPLLFDRNYQPKPAFFSVIKAGERQD